MYDLTGPIETATKTTPATTHPKAIDPAMERPPTPAIAASAPTRSSDAFSGP